MTTVLPAPNHSPPSRMWSLVVKLTACDGTVSVGVGVGYGVCVGIGVGCDASGDDGPPQPARPTSASRQTMAAPDKLRRLCTGAPSLWRWLAIGSNHRFPTCCTTR